MTVWGIYGNVGNGKDTNAVSLIDEWAHLKRLKTGIVLERGLPVYGNLDCFNDVITADVGRTYEPYRKITCDEFLALDPRKDLEKCGVPTDDLKTHALVVISEPHAWGLDSRTGGSKITRAMAIKGTQSRHSRLDIPFTTQIPSEIDKRFRHLCKVTELALEPIEDSNGEIVRFRYAYFGRYQQKLLGIDRAFAKRLWGMYDTEQHIEEEFTDEYLNSLEDNDMIQRPMTDDATERNKTKPKDRKFVTTDDGTRVYEN